MLIGNPATSVNTSKRMDMLAYAALISDYFARDIQDYNFEDLHIFALLANE